MAVTLAAAGDTAAAIPDYAGVASSSVMPGTAVASGGRLFVSHTLVPPQHTPSTGLAVRQSGTYWTRLA